MKRKLPVIVKFWNKLIQRSRKFDQKRIPLLAQPLKKRGTVSKMAWITKMAGKSTSGLLAITSGWFLDYCVYLLWKEFKQKRAFSACWSDTVQGNPETFKPFCFTSLIYLVLVIGNNRPVFLAIYKLIILLRKEVTVAELNTSKRAFHSSIRRFLHHWSLSPLANRNNWSCIHDSFVIKPCFNGHLVPLWT